MHKWHFYTTDEIKPKGWLRRQLEIQAEGLSGNLDKFWPDIKYSGWLGGDREGWERVPYWLDGFIPLAYLLENNDMISRAKRYMDAIISRQQKDGWICPLEGKAIEVYDTWAVLLISKTLTVYYECSKDKRVPEVIYKALKNYYTLLSEGAIVQFGWAKYRWYEGLIAINLIYDIYKEDWIIELARSLKTNGADYNQFVDRWVEPKDEWTLETHVVNMGMMLKYEAASHELFGEEYTDRADYLFSILRKYNGTPAGVNTGDECLSGISPIQGTELCSVMELMYSMEILYAYTGDKKWAERLEVIAFNALPATFSDDMWAHQYVQQSNQMCCKKFPGRSIFRQNNPDAHIFGLEPHFGCCTANGNQGWPKFVLSTFMHNVDTVINAIPVPAELKTEDKYVLLETNYPFENSFTYTVEAKKPFTLKVRIPSFARNLSVDGNAAQGEEIDFEFAEGEKRKINVSFDVIPYLEKRPDNLTNAKCGSLVFSVPIKYEKIMHEYEAGGVVRKFPYCDYDYLPLSDWNYAYSDDVFIREVKGIDEKYPFSSENPPVVLKAKVKKIDWGYEEGFGETLCAKTPKSTAPISEEQEIELYPYGCAKLRMTELPLIK